MPDVVAKSPEEILAEFDNKFVADNTTSWKMPEGSMSPEGMRVFVRSSMASLLVWAAQQMSEKTQFCNGVDCDGCDGGSQAVLRNKTIDDCRAALLSLAKSLCQ